MKLELSDGFQITEFRPSDQSSLTKHLSSRAIYNMTLRVPNPYTTEHAQQWLDRVERQTRQYGQPLNWAIRNKKEMLIGGIGLEGPGQGAGSERTHRGEIGYWLAKRYWGKGIMTNAVTAVCRHAFENLQLVKITAHVFSNNAASARVLEKCGFAKEGYLKKQFVKDEQFIDAQVFGLLADSQ